MCRPLQTRSKEINEWPGSEFREKNKKVKCYPDDKVLTNNATTKLHIAVDAND